MQVQQYRYFDKHRRNRIENIRDPGVEPEILYIRRGRVTQRQDMFSKANFFGT